MSRNVPNKQNHRNNVTSKIVSSNLWFIVIIDLHPSIIVNKVKVYNIFVYIYCVLLRHHKQCEAV